MLDWHQEDIENPNFDREMTQNEIEWLRERVRCLEDLLWMQSKEKQELEQELDYVHQDLVKMNEELHQLYRTKQLTFIQAKEIAKTLVGEEFVAKALAKILSAIYGKIVLPEELLSTPKLISHLNISSQSDRRNFYSEQYTNLRARHIELGSRFIAFRAQFTKLQIQLTNAIAMQENSKELRKLQSLNIQQLQQVIRQSKEHIQQSKENIEESKTLIEREIPLDCETTPSTGIVARQHNKVEQQSEIVNAMQTKIDEQKIEEREERE